MWHAEFKLYLYPAQADYVFDKDRLKALLDNLGLIGEPLVSLLADENRPERYRTGDQFLSLLTFMGCSPNIELEPQADKPYCYIELERKPSPFFVAGKNLKPAKCPHCARAITQADCPDCQKRIDVEKLNWRKTAFYASSWLVIGNIYELEAIPNDHLLDALKKKTGMTWKAAYIRHALDAKTPD